MITIYAIKPYFQKFLQPLLTLLVGLRITPNQVTIFTTLFSMGWGIYFAAQGTSSWYLMPFVFLVRMALNAIDGMLAKQKQLSSRLGSYLNELGDMVSDLFLYLPFALLYPWMGFVICGLSIFTEVAGILATAVGEKRRYDGPMGKSDRAFCLGVMGFCLSLGWMNDLWAQLLLGTLALLLCFTIFFRIKNALTGKSQ